MLNKFINILLSLYEFFLTVKSNNFVSLERQAIKSFLTMDLNARESPKYFTGESFNLRSKASQPLCN